MLVQNILGALRCCSRAMFTTLGLTSWVLLSSCNLNAPTQLPAAPPDDLPSRETAEPPRDWVDTTYNPPVGGTTYQVRTSCGGAQNCFEDLQTAIDQAQLGDVIEVEAGATFVGRIVLPSKSGDGWLYIRTSAHADLPPPGTRVTPADAHLMPKIVLPGDYDAVRTAFGAHHYRLIGLEIKTTAFPHESLVNLGTDGTWEELADTLEEIPSDIILDRVYIHGEPGEDLHFGIVMNGSRSAVIDSYISEVHSEIFDAKGIHIYNTFGVLKIANNYVEGAAENVMVGEGIPRFDRLVPADIEVRNNHFFKQLSWKINDPSYAGKPWSVKNSFEIKNGRRVLIDGNVFENNWAMNQDGDAILFTPRNTHGVMPWAVVEDVIFTENLLINVDAGVESLGEDDLQAQGSDQTKRILISGNFFDVHREALHVVLDVVNGRPVLGVTITHNTVVHRGAGGRVCSFRSLGGVFPVMEKALIRDNIFSHGEFGVFGSGVGTGAAALDTYVMNYGFNNNVLFGNSSNVPEDYPAGNFHPQTVGGVGFVAPSAGDFELSATSPYAGAAIDGTDIGADMLRLKALHADVVSGVSP